MQFRYACDTIPDHELDDLKHIIETAEEISTEEFYEEVKPDPILERFEDQFCKLADSRLIKCYKGNRQNNDTAYYFRYSAIEHVFY